MAQVSFDVHHTINKTNVKISRIRPLLETLIDRRPQARDVKSTRVMEHEFWQETETSQEGFVNPQPPKRRLYIKEITTSQPEESINTDVDQEDHLQDFLDDLSNSVYHSTLKSVGPSHLYTLLARQHEYPSFYSTVSELPVAIRKEEKWEECQRSLITVSVYAKDNATKKIQEIEILSTNKMSALRDSIGCLTDLLGKMGREQEKAAMIDQASKRETAGMFYVDHVFYIDTRAIGQDIYQGMIDRWLEQKGVDLERFRYTTKAMADVVLENITIELERPFAFIHGEACEHMFMFKDMRLLSPNEDEVLEEFPKTIGTVKYVRYKCSMCTIFPSSYVTTGDVLSGCSPCYFCEKCYHAFHAQSEYDRTYDYETKPYHGSIL
ncbi:snRNA-activating protein of 50kDa MW C terminal-domain-containing protein [Sporodiniella umbellata]|nr:snRNA-activating protein of 50kDa MW C terminal-domain-containing protein [Sporodiniella umbellata]